MKRYDKAIAVGIWVLIGVSAYLTSQLEDTTMQGVPGPRYFPTLILGLMAILSILLFIGGFRAGTPKGITGSARIEREHSTFEAIVFFAVFLAGVVLMYFVGFPIGMGLAMAIMLIMAKWKIHKAIIYSAIVVVVIFFLFDRVLQIPLPTGSLFI